MFRAELDPPKASSFTGLSCHQKGYGLGKVVESWPAPHRHTFNNS
jgi:hypothetical protein